MFSVEFIIFRMRRLSSLASLRKRLFQLYLQATRHYARISLNRRIGPLCTHKLELLQALASGNINALYASECTSFCEASGLTVMLQQHELFKSEFEVV